MYYKIIYKNHRLNTTWEEERYFASRKAFSKYYQSFNNSNMSIRVGDYIESWEILGKNYITKAESL